jgi:hypothetical protein
MSRLSKRFPAVVLAICASLVSLNGCGGGGSNSNTTPAPTPTPSNPTVVIASIAPVSTVMGSTSVQVTLTGSGFIASSAVQWNGSSRPTTYVSATQLSVTIPPADLSAAGTAQITVVNPSPGGGTSSATTFTINNPAPVVTGVASAIYVTDAATVVTLTGTGFVPASTVQWNGAARTTTFIDSTQLQATLTVADVASTGTGNITVTTPAPGGGTSASLAAAVTYATPTFTSMTPSGAIVGSSSTAVTVNGAGFAPASVLQWDGVALPTQYVNSRVLRATIPSANLASIGTAQLTVMTPTPGGGTTTPRQFVISSYPLPTISSVTPTSIFANSPDTTISVSGTGFQSVSTIQVNGIDLPTSLVSSFGPKFLVASIPASYFSALGTLQITVNTPPPSGGTSNAIPLTVAAPPAPTVIAMFPTSAPVGGDDFTLTVNGSNFVANSVVRWNGLDRPTAYVGSSQLRATIPSSDLATFTTAQVTVYTPPVGGGTSSSLPFSTYLALPTNDMVYNTADGLFYASVPSTAGAGLGNSIVSIDPNTGVVGTPIWIGSEPNKLALASDNTTLWVGLDGAGAVRKVDLSTKTAGLQFGLGGVTGVYNSPNAAVSIAVMPGLPNTIAVAPYNSGTWWNGGVTVYDSGVARPTTFNNGGALMNVNAIAFSSSGNSIYALGNGYAVLTVDSTGISSSVVKNSTVSGNSFVYDSGKVYLTTGTVLDANTGTQLGVFSLSPTQQANGPLAVDAAVGRSFIAVNPNFGSTYQVNAYDLATYTLKGTAPIADVSNSTYPYNVSLLRWGQDGLAVRTSTRLFILHSPLVRDLSTSLADLSVDATVAATSNTGVDVTYNITVTNSGPVAVTPATLMVNLPSGAVMKSAAPSQGTCSGTAVLRCNLGNLNATSSASVQVVATLLLPGSATMTVTASAPQADPNLANNTVTKSTTVSGNAFSPVPTLSYVSPEFVAAGSTMFTLTANGYGFVNGGTLNWNGTALATTFVSSTELTAQVDATKVAGLGWAWVNVSNPGPGGGTSGSLPVSTYKTINVTSNHILFDPFTRKIYASIPGSATQVTGNSIVAIDPNTGNLGTPMNVGSEPNRLATTADGKYLYIGLDGAKSLTRIDLTTMTQGSVYPLSVSGFGTSGPTTARSLAVMPGNNDTLAIDTGSWTGIGVFDISGATGTFRSTLTGPYTGSNLTFGDASTVYSYDVDTSGSTFNRWTVGANGLTAIDQSTLTGLGGFSGSFELEGGLLYGVYGGVANPSTTPPSQVGRYAVTALGLNQSLQPSSVAADVATDRVFFTGSSTAGTALPYLVSFDRSRFTVLDVVQLPGGSLTGTDLMRWGSDGLAWQMPSWPSYGGSSSAIYLVRGPWVLPEWGASNPVAVATSSTPSSIGAGSGNLMLTVTGSNFVPGAVVLWNGAERSTMFVDATHLKVAVPASDLTSAGNATLTIVNPGAAASGSITFTIN